MQAPRPVTFFRYIGDYNRITFFPTEFGADEYALLQGRVVEFRMTDRMVTLGRSTPSCPVTFDLSLEGPAYKISRRQVSNQCSVVLCHPPPLLPSKNLMLPL